MTREAVIVDAVRMIASRQLPDAIEIVTEVPRTSVSKFDKKRIRAAHAGAHEGQSV